MTDKQIKCWNCKADLQSEDIFCPECKKAQKPGDVDYFTKLGLPCDFEIGEKNLEVAYFALQRKLHPDLFTNKSDEEKRFSLEQTMAVNDAYEALKSPLKRAEYILSLKGFIVNKDGKGTKPSAEILTESMEMREELHEAKDKDAIRAIAVKATDKRISAIDKIKKKLHEKEFEQAAYETIRLRYIEKLLEEVRKK